jgi:hypothetical protein
VRGFSWFGYFFVVNLDVQSGSIDGLHTGGGGAGPSSICPAHIVVRDSRPGSLPCP